MLCNLCFFQKRCCRWDEFCPLLETESVAMTDPADSLSPSFSLSLPMPECCDRRLVGVVGVAVFKVLIIL